MKSIESARFFLPAVTCCGGSKGRNPLTCVEQEFGCYEQIFLNVYLKVEKYLCKKKVLCELIFF